MKNFRDKNVLITGAARGIGRLLAQSFARRGSNLLLVDRDDGPLHDAAKQVRAHGVLAHTYTLDVRELGSMAALRRECHAELGPIDALVHSAGVVHGGPFEQVPLDKHLATYRINVEGMVALTHTFFSDLLRSREAHIVNVASASAFIGLPHGTTYASSKWAVVGFSESLRLELQERGANHVGVTTVCPGYIDTGMFSGVKAPVVLPLLKPEAIVEKIMRAIERNEPFVKEPFVVKTLDLMRGLLPQKVFDVGAQLTGVTKSMHTWTGR